MSSNTWAILIACLLFPGQALGQQLSYGTLKTSKGSVVATHIGDGKWVTVAHIVPTEDDLTLSHPEKRTPSSCRLVGTAPDVDVAVLECESTANLRKLEFVDKGELEQSHRLTVRFFDSGQPSSRILNNTTLSQDMECGLAGETALFSPPPSEGDSGAPLVVQLPDGSSKMFGMWIGRLTKTSASTSASNGVAILSESIRRALATASLKNSAPKLSCPSSSARTDPPKVRCLDALRGNAAESAPAICKGLSESGLRSLQRRAIAERLAFQDTFEASPTLLAIDSAFSVRQAAPHPSVYEDPRLTRMWARVHGRGFGSAIEYRLFDAALASANPADVRREFSTVKPTLMAMMFRLRNQSIENTPAWFYCALEAGAKDLGWGGTGQRPNCDSPDFPASLIERGNNALAGAKCSGRRISVGTLWKEIFFSPRLQAVLWVALQKLGIVDIDAAIADQLGEKKSDLTQRTRSAFSGLEKSLSRLSVLGVTNDVVESFGRFSSQSQDPKISDLVSHNLCRIGKTFSSHKPLTAQLFEARDRLRNQICGLAANGIEKGSWCNPRDLKTARDHINQYSAERWLSQWLNETGMGTWFSRISVSKVSGAPIGSPRYRLKLSVHPQHASNVPGYWRDTNSALKKANKPPLELAFIRAASVALGVSEDSVEVYRNIPCADLTALLVSGELVSHGLQCTRAYDSTKLSQELLKKVVAAIPPEHDSQVWIAHRVFPAVEALDNWRPSGRKNFNFDVKLDGQPCSPHAANCLADFSFISRANPAHPGWLYGEGEIRLERGAGRQYRVVVNVGSRWRRSYTTRVLRSKSGFKGIHSSKYDSWFSTLEKDIARRVVLELGRAPR